MFDWTDRQNNDGGWAYRKGCSWTEPTAFVLLAQTAAGICAGAQRASGPCAGKDQRAFEAGLKYLFSVQRPDGGWSPQTGVAESTWVTALVAMLPEEAIGAERMKSALTWLEGQTGRESTWSYKLQQMIAGNRDRFPDGWPWFPGAAAWVIPTSLGILAFERALQRADSRRLRNRVNSGREFLIAHMCADGGWNHGGNHALGRDGDSYPETTGIALTALRGDTDPRVIARAKSAARRHLASCRTAEGIAWLRIGLAAHGEIVPAPLATLPRTTVDAALIKLADSHPGKNPLLI